MKIRHRPHHWIAVAIALALLLLTLNEAHGQSTGAAAMFEGRPALAGAQGGLGAQAGPPQGGIGLQGNDTGTNAMGAAREAPAVPAAGEVKPSRDQSLAKDQRSSTKKAKRAVKRTISRSRHGVSEFDSTRSQPDSTSKGVLPGQ